MNDIVKMHRPGPPWPPGPPGPPGPPDFPGWLWDGERWVCADHGDGPPRPWPPTHGPQPPFRPPWFDPPQPPWYPGANAGVSFGHTAPANPIRGHFWYDGTNLSMFDGAAWVSIGGGTTGGGTPPATNPPANPQPGQQWFDGTTLWIWDGAAWVPVAGTKTFVQATAPPAPVPGDLWYDGTQLRVWSGSAWMLVGPGATVGPVPTTTNTFAIQQPTALPVSPAASWTIVPWTAVPIIDTQNAYDSITHRLTPTVAGIYNFSMRALIGAEPCGIAIVRNDPGSFTAAASDYTVALTSVGVAIGGYLMASGFVHMNGSTDFVRVWAWDSGGTLPGIGSTPAFQAWLLP